MKPTLLLKVFIAILLGIAISFVAPEWLARVFVTFSGLFSNFLGLIIPLLIIGLIAPSICDLGSGGGKLLIITLAIAYVSTLFSGFGTYFACNLTYPKLLFGTTLSGVDMSSSLTPYFTFEMPPAMSVTTALVTAIALGASMTVIKGDTLKKCLSDFRDVINTLIAKAIIPVLPLYIFSIFLQMGAEKKMFAVLGMFFKIIIVIFVLHLLLLLIQFCIAGAIAKKNPFKALATMLPAYATALGTQSSAATIPVTLAQTIKNGVKPELASFVVPLCATIHLAGSILKIVACSYAISFCMGMPVDLGLYAHFILLVSVVMVAAPGVPGGAIMAAIGVIASVLGFDANMQALMIAIYIALDCFGTACNVTGDGAIALIINKIAQPKA